MAAFAPLFGKSLGVKKAPITFKIDGKVRSGEISGVLSMSVEPLPTLAEGGEMWAETGPSGQPAKAGARDRPSRQHLRRLWAKVGQFGPKRPLRGDKLVELKAPASRVFRA